MRREECGREEKSRVAWLTEGDRNTRVFHILAKARSMVNSMRVVMVNGRRVEGWKGKGNFEQQSGLIFLLSLHRI